MPRRFTDSTYRLLISSSPVTAKPITIAGWIRTDFLTDHHTICQIFDATADKYVEIGVDDIARAQLRDNAGTGQGQFSFSDAFLQLNTWHQVTGVLTNDTTRQVYLDGVAGSNTGTQSTVPSGLANIGMGASDYGGNIDNAIRHDLAHVAIWGVALTQAEVTSLASGISPLFIRPASLKFYAPLDKLGSSPDLIGGRSWSNSGAEALATGAPRIFVPSARHLTPETVAPPYHDETASGTIALPAPSISGETGPYFLEGGDGRRFDGVTYRLFTTTTPVTAAPITIAGWIRVDNTTSQHALACITNVTTASHYWVVRTTTTAGAVQATTRAGGTEATASAGNVPANTWTHIAGVFGAATSRLAYLNGVPGTANTTSRIPAGTGGITQINIGALRSGATTSIATAHDCAHVAIWNAALTTSEILALSRAVYPPLIRPGNLRFYSALDVLGSPPDLSGGLAMSNDGAQALSVSSPQLLRPSVRQYTRRFPPPPDQIPPYEPPAHTAETPPEGGLLTVSADAAVQRGISASIQAAAALQVPAISVSVGASAVVSASANVAAGADAAVQRGISASVQAASAVQSAASIPTSAAAAVSKEFTIAANADAVIAAGITASTTADAAVRTEMPAVVTSIDGATQGAGIAATGTADLAVSVSPSVDSVANAAVAQQSTANAQADAAAAVGATTQAGLDGVIQAAVVATTTSADVSVVTDTQYSEAAARRASIQAYSGGAPAVAAFLDGLASLGAPDRAHIAGAYRGISYLTLVETELQAALDAAIALRQAAIASLDAIAEARRSASADADAGVITGRSISASLDAGVAAIRSVVATLDAIVLAARATLADANAAVTAQVALVATADAAASLARSIDTLVDTVVAAAGERTVSLDALVQATRSITVGLDVLVQTAGLIVVVEAAVLKAMTLTGLADAAVSLVRTATANAEAAAQVASQVIASIDVATQATLEIAADLETAVSAQRTTSVTVDTVVGGAVAGLVTALDAVTESTIAIAADADGAAQQGAVTASLSADVGLARYAFSSIEFDLIAVATLTNTAIADAAVETSISATANVDALVFTFNPFLAPPLPPYSAEVDIETRAALPVSGDRVYARTLADRTALAASPRRGYDVPSEYRTARVPLRERLS